MTWLRRFFCRHAFEIVGKTYSAPVGELKVNGIEATTLERLACGTTSFLLKCPKCGHLTRRLLLGSAAEP